MIKETRIEGNKAIVTFEFSEDDLKVLKHLKEHGYMEFRNNENSAIVDNLFDNGFVEADDYAWHDTVLLTELGDNVVKAMD